MGDLAYKWAPLLPLRMVDFPPEIAARLLVAALVEEGTFQAQNLGHD